MNERIRELALEARIVYYSKNGAYEGADEGLSVIPSTQSLEKFAELMVLECAGVELYWLSEQDRKAVAEKIKEHFGVK